MYEALLSSIKQALPKTGRYCHEPLGGEPFQYLFKLNDSDIYLVLSFEQLSEYECHAHISLVRDFTANYSHELVVFMDETLPPDEIESYLELSLMDDYKIYTKLINTLDKKLDSIAQLLESQELEIDYDRSFSS